ncbi:unnamed protein product, partial [Brassica rapa subsp. narinosa]
DVRSVLTCGGEFNSRHIVRRSGPKALDDPKSSTRPQSGEASSATDRAQVPWKGAPERVRAPLCPDPVAPRGAVYESGCLGMQPQSGGKFRPRLNMGERPIANKYREVKMKRTLKRERLTACLGICVLTASACGLPIRPVLKHGPRSLTCVRVNGIAGARKRVLSGRTGWLIC